nr:GEM-like protein 4 [Ipomoea batatas]
MKQNQIKSRTTGENLQIPINYLAVLLNQSSTKWALPDSAATQRHLYPSSKVRNGAVRLRPKITDILKGKLILGAKLLQAGGIQKVFKKNFRTVRDDSEKLLKASQCYLSTTSGPMPGLLFVSTHKLAFLSDRSIKILSSTGKSMRMHYKPKWPLRRKYMFYAPWYLNAERSVFFLNAEPHEKIEQFELDYDGKRDRWNGYDASYVYVVERYEARDEARKEVSQGTAA